MQPVGSPSPPLSLWSLQLLLLITLSLPSFPLTQLPLARRLVPKKEIGVSQVYIAGHLYRPLRISANHWCLDLGLENTAISCLAGPSLSDCLVTVVIAATVQVHQLPDSRLTGPVEADGDTPAPDDPGTHENCVAEPPFRSGEHVYQMSEPAVPLVLSRITIATSSHQ